MIINGNITKKEDFGYPKELLQIYLQKGFSFLFKGYKIVLSQKQYSLKEESTKLENTIRDDIYREAVRLLEQAALNDRGNRFLEFSFYNENRDVIDESDVKRFDISLNYDSAAYRKDIIIECKRLSKNTKNQAYINNGVERFVTNRYGYGLPIGAMIGFIEDGEELKIVKDLQQRLNKTVSITEKFTVLKSSSAICSTEYNKHIHQSNHKRNASLDDIEIYHLMMDFTSVIFSE